jgi:hypothetical protein
MNALRANLGHLPTVQVVHAAITNHSEAMRQHATYNLRHATCGAATCKIRNATCKIQYATCKTHATCPAVHKLRHWAGAAEWTKKQTSRRTDGQRDKAATTRANRYTNTHTHTHTHTSAQTQTHTHKHTIKHTGVGRYVLPLNIGHSLRQVRQCTYYITNNRTRQRRGSMQQLPLQPQ